MLKKILTFSVVLIAALLVVALVHWLYLLNLDRDFEPGPLVLSYIVNFGMALAIYAGMFYLAIKQNKYLGFIFLWGSALKFAVYFLVLHPVYSTDGQVTQLEFFYFFVPYIVSLLLETIGVVYLLRSMEK